MLSERSYLRSLPKPNVRARIERVAEMKQAPPPACHGDTAVSVDDAEAIELAVLDRGLKARNRSESNPCDRGMDAGFYITGAGRLLHKSARLEREAAPRCLHQRSR